MVCMGIGAVQARHAALDVNGVHLIFEIYFYFYF